MMANARNGTLYLGSTVNLPKRAWEHRNGVVGGFTKKYGCKLLVWYKHVGSWEAARQRELHMRGWKRAWKVREIEGLYPEWKTLRPDRAAMNVVPCAPPLPG
ncbi:GIY-YIG nuclease family protein [uncultured Sphingomonas sp.]|uniref:GIY-YIG nuclease family protein n=1 Tax=uncultured Sphingomonas sp. TaxID=158754 RepID=UPI0035C9CEBC